MRHTNLRRRPTRRPRRTLSRSSYNDNTNNSRPFIRSTAILPSHKQFFPEELFCTAKTVYANTLASAASSYQTLVGNSPLYNYGPQINYTGSYQLNVPAGCNYLLSSPISSGSTAPYSIYWCYETDFTIEIITSSSAASVFSMFPSNVASLSGMAFNAYTEQRGAVTATIPTTTNASPLVVKVKVLWYDVFGVSKDVYLSNTQFAGVAGALPSVTAFLQYGFNSFTGNLALSYKMTAESRYKFAAINTFISTQPS